MLPIENSIGGSIHRNFDLLLEHHLPIVGELEVPVVHHLLALPGRTLEHVKRIYSHPQALAQCDRFLRTLSGVEITATYDTAGSAKMIADEQLEDAAAIASARAAEVFGLVPLQVVHPGLREQHHALPGRRPAAAVDRRSAGQDHIVFTLANEPGALFKALSVFALRGIDLTKLESRPIPGPQVGIPVLRRSGGGERRSGVRAGAGPSGRVRADGARARLVSPVASRRRRQAPRPFPRDARVTTTNGRNPLTTGPSRAPARAMLKGAGFTDADLKKPLIGVANTWIEIGPCNLHLRTLAEHVKAGIRAAGAHADGIQHGVDLRRHHDGHRGDARLARQPRGDRRFDRAGGARQRLRRPGRARRLRQDHSRRRDGAGAAERARASCSTADRLRPASSTAARSRFRTCSRRSARTRPAG